MCRYAKKLWEKKKVDTFFYTQKIVTSPKSRESFIQIMMTNGLSFLGVLDCISSIYYNMSYTHENLNGLKDSYVNSEQWIARGYKSIEFMYGYVLANSLYRAIIKLPAYVMLWFMQENLSLLHYFLNPFYLTSMIYVCDRHLKKSNYQQTQKKVYFVAANLSLLYYIVIPTFLFGMTFFDQNTFLVVTLGPIKISSSKYSFHWSAYFIQTVCIYALSITSRQTQPIFSNWTYLGNYYTFL